MSVKWHRGSVQHGHRVQLPRRNNPWHAAPCAPWHAAPPRDEMVRHARSAPNSPCLPHCSVSVHQCSASIPTALCLPPLLDVLYAGAVAANHCSVTAHDCSISRASPPYIIPSHAQSAGGGHSAAVHHLAAPARSRQLSFTHALLSQVACIDVGVVAVSAVAGETPDACTTRCSDFRSPNCSFSHPLALSGIHSRSLAPTHCNPPTAHCR